MVRSRLHIICGNCGSSATDGLMDYRLNPEDGPYISCRNCGTLHPLRETVQERGPMPKPQEEP